MREQHQAGIGRQIARLREQHGWSQRELAKAVGLDQSAVSRIEAGRRRVSAEELHRFTRIFSVTADALLVSETSVGNALLPWITGVTQDAGEEPWQPPGGSVSERRLLSAIEQARIESGATQAPTAASSGSRPARPATTSPARGVAGSPEAAPATMSLGAPLPGLREHDDLEARQLADEAAPDATAPAVEPPAWESRMPLRSRLALSAREPAGGEPEQRAFHKMERGPLWPTAPGPASTLAADWSAEIAGVVRDWFELRRLASEQEAALPWSTGQSAEGKSVHAPRPWQPVAPAPGTGDVLYDRIARFWRSELHVDPDDGAVPDLVPLLEDGLGVQVIVARVADQERALAASTTGPPPATVPHPVAAEFVSDGVPFAFINAGRPVVLQRYALVHAFAHLALGHGDVVDEIIGWSRANPREAAANDFAEEFLAPVRAVERWYARRSDTTRGPSLDTLLEMGNAFGISAWAALFRTRAAGRVNPKQFAALRAQMRREEWELLPRQAFLGGLRDTLAHLTPAEVLPPGRFGGPAVLRVPAPMRIWTLVALREGRLSLEDAAAMLRMRPGALAEQLARLGLE